MPTSTHASLPACLPICPRPVFAFFTAVTARLHPSVLSQALVRTHAPLFHVLTRSSPAFFLVIGAQCVVVFCWCDEPSGGISVPGDVLVRFAAMIVARARMCLCYFFDECNFAALTVGYFPPSWYATWWFELSWCVYRGKRWRKFSRYLLIASSSKAEWHDIKKRKCHFL